MSSYSSSSDESSTSSSDELAVMPVAPVKKPRVKRNILEVEPVTGEGNLKGFVSALQTIIERPAEATLLHATPVVDAKPKKASTEVLIVSHDKVPTATTESETALAAMAERGIVKLFRAVAMNRKRAIDYEASKGIGLTKSGQRRNRPVRRLAGAAAPTATPTGGSTTSMTSFLDMLKKQKSATSTST